jgi:hypothetical protein
MIAMWAVGVSNTEIELREQSIALISWKNVMQEWISEQNPQLSVDLYKDLSDAIGGLRAEFATVQARLIDIKREHEVLRKRFPSSLIVGKRAALDIVIVTSAQTKDTFKLGEENNVDVFGNK